MKWPNRVGIAVCVLLAACAEESEPATGPETIRTNLEKSLTAEIKFEKYSEDAVANHLEQGKPVVVVVRSKYSLWSPELLQIEQLDEDIRGGELAAMELVWSWDEETIEVKPIFEEFGRTKEAFLVKFSSDGSKRRINLFE